MVYCCLREINTKELTEELQMGFFQDLKEDLSQAVNEMIPDE